MTRSRSFAHIVLALIVALTGLVVATPAFADPTVPDKPSSFVANEADALNAKEKASVERYLVGVNSAHSQQVYVYVNRSFDGMKTADLASSITQKWGLDSDDVLMLFATEDGSVRIQIGPGSRQHVTDQMASQIAQESLSAMRQGQNEQAINGAATAVLFRLEGVDPSNPSEDDHDHEDEGPTTTLDVTRDVEDGKGGSKDSSGAAPVILKVVLAGLLVLLLGAMLLALRRKGYPSAQASTPSATDAEPESDTPKGDDASSSTSESER